MYAEERQALIARRAHSDGRVDVSALAAELTVTTETVRRDLTALERAGLLKRVHGGAIPVDRLVPEPGVADREQVGVAEKERIATAALAEVPAEGSVLLDGGTTVARLAEALPADRPLTVLTTSLPIAVALSARPALSVHVLGGRVRARTLTCVDSWALALLEGLCADVAFLGANGVSVERGLTTPDPAEAAVKTAMMRAARRSVVLADHRKLGDDHLVRFAGLDEVEVLVTDSGVDAAAAEALEAAGPRVVRA